MFIDANAITVLIEKYEAISAGMDGYWDARRSWADRVVRDLEGLIDQEAARLDKMAEDYAAEEYGRQERANAAIEKELEVDFNWPHGV
ncbi:MAG: hypothetical protein QF662_04590 [Phycisphaerae bacterium]|nr:hypothetical protein [Candidatus Pacearchaeota archaeon]MDP6380605.1 hypothetical protein [Phycisphaerae bacterium]|tara:strand:+ start:198 stop:461 length:264 start_codon:yes stop_codon:yes gene_type:complete